jgi:para-nitrobenzyl esterase
VVVGLSLVLVSTFAGAALAAPAHEGDAAARGWSAPTTTVATASGAVRGLSLDGRTLMWQGVPYARPPVGALRWKAPVAPIPWSGVRDATTNPDVCTQQVYDQYWRPSDAFTGSEDCLYLNVYRPKSAARNLPVYYFIHGGAGNFGGLDDYDPSELAARENIIVVTVQFRLSALGFLTHPALRIAGSAADRSGDYATLDQIKGLAWVRDNIAAFGGNGANVVIGGQSNGAGCAMDLLFSPLARGLFRGAVLQSTGAPPLTQASVDASVNTTIDGLLMRDSRLAHDGRSLTAAEAAAYRATMSSAQIADYLRGKTAVEILQARRDGTGADGAGSMPGHEPSIDGYVIPNASWADMIADGAWAKVPVMIGNAANEWNDFAQIYGPAIKYVSGGTVPSGSRSWADLFRVIGVGGQLALADVLPMAADRAFYTAVTDLKSRQLLMTGTDQIAREIKTANPRAGVWAYRFDWKGGGDPALADFATVFGAAHSMDIPFFQGQTADAWGVSFTAANKAGRVALQRTMMGYLGAFVRTLDPNRAPHATAWPQWSPAQGAVKSLVFDAGLTRTRLSYNRVEQTTAGLSVQIAAARTAYPANARIFDILGLAP